MHEPRSARHQPLQQLISKFLAAADWPLLCNRLLPLLPDQQLLAVVQQLSAELQRSNAGHRRSSSSSSRSSQQSGLPASLRQWLDQQAACNVSACKATPGLTETAPAAMAAVAAAASQLPCVPDLTPLVLCPFVQHWDLRQLLLANALACHRHQLLSLLRHEEESGQQLLQLVAAAQQLFTQPLAAVAAGVQPVLRQLFSAQGGSDKAQAKVHLQVLLSGWLLRLHVLLAGTAGAGKLQDALQLLGCSCRQVPDHQQQRRGQQAIEGGAEMQQRMQLSQQLSQKQPEQKDTQQRHGEQQQPQQQQQLLGRQQDTRQGLNTGDEGQAGREGQAGPERQAAPKGQAGPDKQARPGPEEVSGQQQQQPRQPLRRGRAAAMPHASSSGSEDSNGNSSDSDRAGAGYSPKQQRPDKRQRMKPLKLAKRRKVKLQGSKGQHSKHVSKHTRKAAKRKHGRKRRHSSCSEGDGSHSSSSEGSQARKRLKRDKQHSSAKQHKQRTRRSENSNDSWTSDSRSSLEAVSSMDLDAAGELLDPEDFSTWTGHATAPAGNSLQQGQSADMGRHVVLEQQMQLNVHDALASVSVGGQLWQSPHWLATLPVHQAAATTAEPAAALARGSAAAAPGTADVVGSPGGLSLAVFGTTAEIADAVAWYFVWQWMAALRA